jgi:CopA family copper-resistance protein
MNDHPILDRRAFMGASAALAASAGLMPAWAAPVSHGTMARKGSDTLSGTDIRLTVANSTFSVDGKSGHAITINGTLPAPLIRLKEGTNVRLTVENHLDEDSSIHWHGLLVPFQMDGVPGVSFPGIPAHSSFTYEFPVIQSGTYWYHSHSGLQEQSGHYGPMIIDPAGPDPVAYDREQVIVLSDWTFMHPHQLFLRLKQEAGMFNRQKSSVTQPLEGVSAADKAMFDRMRMDPTDISDTTALVHRYLVNGHGPADNWTGLFTPGERVRLRVINAAAQTIFNLRIPGLKLTVVAADGANVRPVEVDELQIGNAETYDIIVTPDDQAYTLVAENIDRSGMASATFAPRAGMRAAVPPLRKRPVLTMKDMGMGAMDHGSMPGMDHGAMDHGSMNHDMRDKSKVAFPVGPGVDMIAPMPVDRIGEPGLGLDNVGHRVLNYRDLVALTPHKDQRVPTRRIDIHLTGNMERFMWSIDGEKLSERPEPYRFARNERVRLRLINDTMMTHPMHLHGHFFELVNGHGSHQPHKHTVRVLPGGYVDLDLTADAPGDWAFHCHMLYHMHAGMMRVVTVRPMEGDKA